MGHDIRESITIDISERQPICFSGKDLLCLPAKWPWSEPVEIAYSVNGVPVRLTEERWGHIVENKPYMKAYYERVLATVENSTWILRGYGGALIAVLSLGRRQFLNVLYREVSRQDGFIITAFVSRRINRGDIIWPKERH